MNTLLDNALTAAKAAGDEIMKHYGTSDFESKSDTSPVTIADTRANEVLIAHLSQTSIPILSEESVGIPIPYPNKLWVIDPLDGTKDFLNYTKNFSVMIGLLEHGRPTLGVVYAPLYNAYYYAVKGEGTHMVKDGVATKLTITSDPTKKLRFICSVNNFKPYMDVVTEKLSAEKTPHGSIGIKAGVLCENKGDFIFSHGKFGEWDVCAPEIIVEEAGGIVTDCEGNPLTYGTTDHRLERGVIFSSSDNHARILEAVHSTPF
jgi:3'(2'), 5'-bisphosphate nucleotidase